MEVIIIGGLILLGMCMILGELPTRRERFIAAALAGLLADPEDHEDERMPGESCEAAVARKAVKIADEVEWRLNEEGQK